ncbi:hypothetical protein LZQ00_14540 [Sphingobacterium sp. SRCM116780]|uniref:hypothetical protein n=1 Tax=Sphingobacterium sp. SRCM116780 TaxID=2907623 RepID=UPI001F2871BF|nr:hypothetical protein [Sphingobacterium sp. SRCM116780]UIR55477.1 hypothetical protein LZQ00_14540 [Sphingobacterium sp. SRCM116780]
MKIKYFSELIFMGLLLLVTDKTYSQSGKPLMQKGIEIPPSPEVSELGRISQLGTELFTGSSKVDVPLYTIKIGDINFPLSLKYSNNGIRVSDIPSRVGLGWSTLFSGMVSRVVKDEPDDESTFLSPPDFNSLDQGELTYLESANLYGNDTEHDIFSFAAGDISGQFFIDANKIPRLISHSNVKIDIVYTSGKIEQFMITNGLGIQYYFGEQLAIEKTREINLNPSQGPKQKISKTAWFLTKILSPEGNSINFQYSSIYIKNNLPMQQSVHLEPTFHNGINPITDYCGYCQEAIGGLYIPTIYYDTKYLSKITTSKGESLDFEYESRPDASGDNRLKNVKLNYGTSLLKQFAFIYSNVPTNGKFYLDTLKILPVPASPNLLPQNYIFSYLSPMDVRDITYKGLDFYGFDNGILSNINLFPKFNGYQNYKNGDQGANRSPDANYAIRGALNKITYPTGGFDEYFYEGHDIHVSEQQTSTSTVSAVTDGLSQMTGKSVSSTFVPEQTQTVNISYRVELSPGAPSADDPEYWPAQDLDRRVATLEFFKGATRVFKQDVWGYVNLSQPVSLELGQTYQLKVTAYGRTNSISAYLAYDPKTTDIDVNKPASGIRVSKISSFDPVTNKTESRYFKYCSLADGTKSSGVGSMGGGIFESNMKGGWCVSYKPSGAPIWGEASTVCNLLSVQSSSTPLPQAFGGSPMAYKYVLESKDPNFNSGIEHEFTAYNNVAYLQAILNAPMMSSSQNLSADLNGKEVRSLVFKKDVNGAVQKVSEQFNTYNVLSQGAFIENYLIRKKWERPGETDPNVISMPQVLSGWDVNVYTYGGGWPVLESQENVVYDLNGSNPVKNTVNYSYLNPVHAEPTEEKRTMSNGKVSTTNYFYPTDLSSTVYVGMVNKHILSKVVKKVEKVDSNVSFTQNIYYKDWLNNGKVYRPEKFTVQRGSLPEELVVENIAMDNFGNINTQTNGTQTTSYLWGYGGQYPIAEIKNATYTEVLAVLGQTTINNLNALTVSEATINTAMNTLRTHASLSKAMVTSYTYKPLVGMTSKTDPRGVTEYYEYDGMQRLKTVLDQFKYINTTIDYHYKAN